jgi:acylpyruvate hydrolase
MLLVSYRAGGSSSSWRAGIAHEQAVADASAYFLSRADEAQGPGDLSVRALLQQGPQALEEVFAWAKPQFETRSQLLPLDTLELGPPVPDPDKMLCLGVNYREHAAEAQQELPAVPMFFAKFRNSLSGPSSPILLPRVSTQIDYEGELAVIIGTRCKDVAENAAM